MFFKESEPAVYIPIFALSWFKVSSKVISPLFVTFAPEDMIPKPKVFVLVTFTFPSLVKVPPAA